MRIPVVSGMTRVVLKSIEFSFKLNTFLQQNYVLKSVASRDRQPPISADTVVVLCERCMFQNLLFVIHSEMKNYDLAILF